MLKNPSSLWLRALCPTLVIAAVNLSSLPGARADDPPALGSSAPEPIVESTTTGQTGQTTYQAPAQTSEPKVDTVTREHVEDSDDPNAARFSLFGGAGLGYSWLSDSTDSNKKGLNFEARVTGALYNPKVVFDLGLGWLYSKLSGSSTTAGVTTDTTITTQAGFVDLSPRFRFADSRFELGLLGRVMFGTNTDFGPVDTQSGAQVFIGPKATWAWLDKDVQYRLGLQLITDLTVTDRQVWMPLLSFEIGIPLFKSKTVVRETETTRTEYVDKIVEVEKEKIVEKIVTNESVLVFDDEVVHFEINKATLYPESRKFFAEVGKFLAAHQDLWKTLKVSGHTDATGPADANLKLSKQRAGSVARVLVASGVPASKIKTAGYGESRPVDPGNSSVAFARNRRVEISFGEGASSKRLHEEINRIKLRTIKPRTCERDRCR